MKKANTRCNLPDTSIDNEKSKMNMQNWLKASNDKNTIQLETNDNNDIVMIEDNQ